MAATKAWTLVFGELVIRALRRRLKVLRRLFQREPERFPFKTVSTAPWMVIGFQLGSKADVYLRKACIRHSLDVRHVKPLGIWTREKDYYCWRGFVICSS